MSAIYLNKIIQIMEVVGNNKLIIHQSFFKLIYQEINCKINLKIKKDKAVVAYHISLQQIKIVLKLIIAYNNLINKNK